MTCRTCKFLLVPADKIGRRVPRSNNTYRCTVELPQPALPASVTFQHNFQWPPARTYMEPDSGEGCPLWETVPR